MGKNGFAVRVAASRRVSWDPQSSAGAGDLTGAASAADLSWVHQAALEGGHIGTIMTDLGGFDPDGFDFHSPEMIGAEHLAALDQAAALGAGWMWVG